MTIFSVALAEIRTVRRKARFWTVVVVLSLCSLIGYISSSLILGYSATASPSFGPAALKYLLGNIEPTFFLLFQISVLFLAFDADHQHRRIRIDEVLDSRPVHNYEYLSGRAIGIAGLLWFFVAILLAAMQVLGLIAETFNFGFAESLQFHSFLNLLLLDAPIMLLFWSAFVVFLSSLVRSRLAVLGIGLIAMFAWYLLVLNTPFHLLGIVSPSSNDSLFISDLVPEFATWQTIAIRLGTLLIGIGLIATSSILMKRRDSGLRLPIATVPTFAFVIGGSICAFVAANTFYEIESISKWRQSHQSYDWKDDISLKKMSGEIHIDPRRHLTIDLDLTLEVGRRQTGLFVFTLNPGLKIQELRIDDLQAGYSFEEGLLEVEVPPSIAAGSNHVVNVVAQGIPNPRFAYLDSAINYLSDSATPRQAIMLLGRDGSVFDSEYVALMPGAYWYPVPGPVKGDFLSTQKGLDYFDVDLSVTVNATGWRPVGTGTTTKTTESDQAFRLTSNNPLHEFGLFASNFASASLQINETTFAMYLHQRHSNNIGVLKKLEDLLRVAIQDRLQRSKELGLSLSHDGLTFVEVPRRLRAVGGGWRMNSVQALPGVYLLKEHAFPTSRMDLLVDRKNRSSVRNRPPPSEEEDRNAKLASISSYFNRGIGTDSAWSSLSDFLWTHSTSASGAHSHVLHQIMLCLLSELHPTEHWEERQFFNVYMLFHFAELTRLSIFEGSLALMDLTGGRRVGGSIHATLALREDYTDRISLWNRMEKTSLSELPTSYGIEYDLEHLLFKASHIAHSLLSLNGVEKIAEWMAAIQAKSAGSTYTLEDAIQIAKQHDVIVNPFLTTWLRGNSLPGYVTSPYTTIRIADDAEGSSQYLTSVDIRNTQAVSGLVRLRYPTELESRIGTHFMDVNNESDAVLIEGNSAKRINLVSNYEISWLYLNPGPSLNRNRFALVEKPLSSSERTQMGARPFIEESTWSPIVEEAIIVDDLDPTFTVVQPRVRISRRSLVGPIGWLRAPRLEAEMDAGLPAELEDYLSGYRVPKGTWARKSELKSFGKYRKTTAVARIQDRSTRATFEASIPESSRWHLDYHAPVEMSWLASQPEVKYRLAITNEQESWDIDVAVGALVQGWNSVGEFELNAGSVSVDLTGTTEGVYLYADAIRWTRASEE